jgi:4-hydroxy-2-oxoheptanedioate aldolase
MRENQIRKTWGGGRAIVNGWLAAPSAFVAEVMAHAGFDSLTIDMQHGLADYGVAVSMIQAINTTDVTPLVRVPWNEPGIIMRMLDAGSYGIICPMVNTRRDAEAFVGACRYAPAGYRSFGPTRVSLYAGGDYGAHANSEILALAMIETAEALSNLEDILSVPGLDGIYVGPADLSISLGQQPNVDPSAPEVVDAIATILAAARQRGLLAGIHTGGAEAARKRAEQGFGFVTIASDARILSAAAADAVRVVKGASDTQGVAY